MFEKIVTIKFSQLNLCSHKTARYMVKCHQEGMERRQRK
jgi:hypothetical protein